MSDVQELSPREKYWQFRRGWQDAAGGKTMDVRRHCPPRVRDDPSIELNPDLVTFYNAGFSAGSADRNKALGEAAKAFGYEYTILRAEGTDTGRVSCG
jgi:hypothetical protein